MHSWSVYFFWFKAVAIPEVHRELFRKYYHLFVKFQEAALAASEQPINPKYAPLPEWLVKVCKRDLNETWDGRVNVYALEEFKIILENTSNNLQKNIMGPLQCYSARIKLNLQKFIVL